MTTLHIQYKDSEGNISERTISEIEVEGAGSIIAFCHLRQERRTFNLKRIHSAIDVSTGELVDDLIAFFGIPQTKADNSLMPSISAKPLVMSGEELRRLRSNEKSKLWGKFGPAVVVDLYKKKLFALFGNKCFKCGAPSPLEVDHHIPMVLGGHLVPGNLVALCTNCNNKKLDLPPMQFYSPEELAKLEPILKQETSLFEFVPDQEFWSNDRKGYLLSLGIDAKLVEEVLNNPNHRFYIEPPTFSKGSAITITFDLSSLIK
jgi:hypothetical protein